VTHDRCAAEDVAQQVFIRVRERPTARRETALLVLTGAGGGELAVPPGERPTPPDVTVTADVVSFCRLVGGRIRPADLSYRTDGEGELGRELVETAASFASP
jgi:hypothetical protein